MIEFKGHINSSSSKCVKKQLTKGTCIGSLIALLFLGVPSILAWVYFDIWIFTCMFFGVILVMLCLTKITLSDALPVRILIDIKGNEVYGEYRKGATNRSIDDIKKVFDYGEFYHITFYFPNQWANCICQKDLIVQGTIEEFEKLFEDKIVRKYKQD